ncbi:Chromo domain protein [Pseudocohnilembus persalinus]|uniref:Histone acetyltransferase n=1 Tax=Pseudocohnilembus persalinus TaxID=266149 RepID=A0A0V0QDT2_PSEPJ|nr:Chromo domain protein [Pseudocohnilembus persalinus]|eukprot:KRX00326.1 Chromo domain protein [Pseudocohnilembus persalinus]
MASKGKGLGKMGTFESDITKLKLKNEGAINPQYYVEGQMKDGTWEMARIVDCRLSKSYIDFSKPKKEDSYDYYIHYLHRNRRMDEWVDHKRIKKTDKLIEEEPVQKKKKKHEEKKVQEENDEHEGMDETALAQHEEMTKFKTIQEVEIGKNRSETWYYSPFPPGYHNVDCLYFCEFCLSFYTHKRELDRHASECILTHPPGDEIYRDDSREQSISMYEVDGSKNQVYCENLGYLSKLFLDHKNLYYNMEPFLFFILCENDENGSHIVGYFSKEKESSQGWNLACILTLPMYQRKGYGKLLITFSYELSLIENKIGTPERPLSDMGKQAYLSWWTQRIVNFIKNKDSNEQFSIKDIEKATGIRDQDALWTMEQTGLIKYQPGEVSICTDPDYLEKLFKEAGRPGVPVHPEKIHWVPYRYKWDKDVKFNFNKINLDKLKQ